MEDLIESANCKLFKNSQNQHLLLLPIKPQTHKPRPKGHTYQIPNYINVPLFHIAYSNTINLSSILFFLCFVFMNFCVFCTTILVSDHTCIAHVRLLHV